MTDRTLPLLFINLGGEMLYILEDRLKAQSVSPEKGKKVLHDIIAMMLNVRFVEELFKPQELYNKQALRSLFDNLAHVSIMRLNRASMNKLYDLMVMVVKYQLCSVLRPQDILLVTLNHLEAMMIHPNACISRLIENFHSRYIKMYAHMTSGEIQTMRYCILNYLQDERVRVSVLLREGLQNPDGRFVIPISGPVPAGFEVPVIIRTFAPDGSMVTQEHFSSGGHYEQSEEVGSLGLHRNHQTTLGQNIYKTSESSVNRKGKPVTRLEDFNAEHLPGLGSGSESLVGREELNMLARLLGPASVSEGQELHLDLFSSAQEEEAYVQQRMVSFPGQSLTIDARSQGQPQELAAVFREMSLIEGPLNFNLAPANSSEDLLDFLDSA